MSEHGFKAGEVLRLGTVLESGAIDLARVEAYEAKLSSEFACAWAIGSTYQGTRVPFLGVLREVGQQQFTKLSLEGELPPPDDVLAFDVAGSGLQQFLMRIARPNGNTLSKSFTFKDMNLGLTSGLRLGEMDAFKLSNWRIVDSDRIAVKAAQTEYARIIRVALAHD